MVQKTSSQLSSLIRGFPGLGIIPYLNDNYPQRIFKKWSLEMKEPVIAVRMGGKDIVVVNTYDEAFEVLSKQGLKTAGRPPIFIYAQVAQNHGIAFKDYDEAQKIMRKFALRQLRKRFGNAQAGTTMESIISEQADHLISELKKVVGKSIDIKGFIYRLSFNVISKVISGKSYEYDDPVLDKLFDLISYVMSESEDAAKMVHLNLFPSLRFFPPYRRVNEKAKKYLGSLCDFIQQVLDEHKANFNPSKSKNMIDEFLHSQMKSEEHFTDRQLIHVALDLITGGTDTTASSIAWLILCYLHHPQYQKKLDEEINRVFGTSNIVPKLDLKSEMPFTFAFLLEMMRYRTTVSMTYRKNSETLQIGKYTIPKGSTILVNILGLLNDPLKWPNPEKFDPYRHIDDNGNFVPSSKVISFSLGYRSCPGENLARKQVFIVFVKLLQAFRISSNLDTLPTLENGYNNLVHSSLPYTVTLSSRLH